MTATIEALKERARRHEQDEEWRKALDLYLRAIKRLEEEDRPDIGLHNRVGDLCTRVGALGDAVEHYEMAVLLYDEADLPNNAIAVCKKILRNVPQRHEVFLHMGKIRARQGFVVDAREHFLTYAERVRAGGDLDEALRALVEFADLVPDDAEVRLALAAQYEAHDHMSEATEQLGMAYGIFRAAGNDDRAEELAARLQELDPEVDLDALARNVKSAAPPPAPEPLPFETTALSFGDDDALGGLDDFEIALGDEGAETEEVEGAAFDEAGGEDALEGAVFHDEGESEDEEEEEDGLALETPLPYMSFDDEEAETDSGADVDVDMEPLPFLEGTEELGAPVEPSAPFPTAAESAAADAWTAPEVEETSPEPDVEAETGFDEAPGVDDAPAVEEVAEVDHASEAEDEVSVQQRVVERAFQAGDEGELILAYLGLAGALERSGAEDRARSVFQQVASLDPDNAEALEALQRLGGEAPPAPEVASSEDYVDLGALILGDDAEKSTRFVVAYEEPSGDEDADFARMLSQFKAKVAQNVDASDVRAHHDLGMAYREMGLLDEAIEQFQKALRASADHLATYEALGQAFLEKNAPAAAVRVLTRALDAPWEVEDELLGIYYYLGRAYEAQGDQRQAVEFYDRVFSLDINFADVTERLRVLR